MDQFTRVITSVLISTSKKNLLKRSSFSQNQSFLDDRSEALSAKEQMLNSIRQHLKDRELFQKNNEVYSYSDDVDDSNETDILWHNIYRLITLICLLVAICRQVSFRLNRYKTLYIIKSSRWLDEDGQSIAIATSIPVSQGSTVLQSFGGRHAKDVDCLRDRKRDQVAGGGDLWMLLMSEEDLDLDKKKTGTKSKKRSLIKK